MFKPLSNSLLSVPFQGGFGDVSPYMCSYYFFSVSFAEWPPFGIATHSVDHRIEYEIRHETPSPIKIK